MKSALVILFRHKLNDGRFGIETHCAIDSGSIWGNRTYALATRNLADEFRLNSGSQPKSDLLPCQSLLLGKTTSSSDVKPCWTYDNHICHTMEIQITISQRARYIEYSFDYASRPEFSISTPDLSNSLTNCASDQSLLLPLMAIHRLESLTHQNPTSILFGLGRSLRSPLSKPPIVAQA